MSDNPTLAVAMGYAAGLREAGDCYADHAAVVLLDEVERLQRENDLLHVEAKLAAKMLARQCDLAREAELEYSVMRFCRVSSVPKGNHE